MNIHPMAAAGLAHLADGDWTLHSRFSQAINYQHAEGQLLTFYRHGKGMGPAGILLSSDDFSRCFHLQAFVKQGSVLHSHDVQLLPRRQLCLSTRRLTLCRPDLSALHAVTGLCGALRSLDIHGENYQSLLTGLQHGYSEGRGHWSALLGKGPGLTPSGDDMLLGAMAVLHASAPWPRIRMATFLPPADQLATLTTSVSCSYLNSAREGLFSTPILRVLRHMHPARNPQPAIQRLLSVGHTSGADILCGMIGALDWLRTL